VRRENVSLVNKIGYSIKVVYAFNISELKKKAVPPTFDVKRNRFVSKYLVTLPKVSSQKMI
jgi:hypothetical protein